MDEMRFEPQRAAELVSNLAGIKATIKAANKSSREVPRAYRHSLSTLTSKGPSGCRLQAQAGI